MNKIFKNTITLLIIIFGLSNYISAQFKVGGDFRFRFYNDSFKEALDNRGTENYIRTLGRINGKLKLGPKTSFYTEVISMTGENELTPVRNIAGTGKMTFGISKMYAQFVQPNLGFIDLLRIKVGKQQFPIGKGLSLAESYYYLDNFNGARLDMAIKGFNLSLFGAITAQNLSKSGLYPDPGSDQIWVGRLSKSIFKHNLMAYHIYHKFRGEYNDNYISGGGINSKIKIKSSELIYFAEAAYQNFNTLAGLPKKAGIGYMGGISYRFKNISIFKSIKIETRYAAYQGDDETTTDIIEQFSPVYPGIFWGDRTGYINGVIGGIYPHENRYMSGSRMWYSRIYFIPKVLPQLRLQFQYLQISEYINNDNYNTLDNEFAVKLYYKLSKRLQAQLRYVKSFPNGQDFDLNEDGTITWAEDRVNKTRFMIGFQFKF